MDKTRLSLFYLVGYTLFGGLGFLAAPTTMLRLFGATGEYSELMVRMVGLMLVAIGIIVTQIVRLKVEQLYSATLVVRSVILGVLTIFYVTYGDPLVLVLFFIVGVGVVMTLAAYLLDRHEDAQD